METATAQVAAEWADEVLGRVQGLHVRVVGRHRRHRFRAHLARGWQTQGL